MRLHSLSLGPLTVDEYLKLEESSTHRHEFVAGRVYEMSGTTARHNQIVLNIVRGLDRLVAGTACRSYIIDLKVRTPDDRIYYPDVVVVCVAHAQDAEMFDAPCFIVEVTSPSTRRTDRGEKLESYLKVASLQGYLVVEQDRRHVTQYQRDGTGWKRDEVTGSGAMRIPCADGDLSLDEAYTGIEMPLRVREEDEDVEFVDYH